MQVTTDREALTMAGTGMNLPCAGGERKNLGQITVNPCARGAYLPYLGTPTF